MEYNEQELYSLICESSEEAKEILFEKYKYLIDTIIKKYIYKATKLGCEYSDLYQEAMIAFNDAVDKFDEERNVKFKTFASLCIERSLQNVIMKAGRNKNKILLESLSLDYTYHDNQLPLKELISDSVSKDPLEDIERKEELNDLIESANQILSNKEKEVFSFMLKGYDYQKIAILLNKDAKQIDNAIQRIKQKIKKMMKEII